MLTSKAKFSANAATTFGLATAAALWMAAVPFTAALPPGPPAIRSARAAQRPCKSAAP